MILILILIILIILLLIIKQKEHFNNDNKISVIILNYNRPHNIQNLVPKLVEYQNIGEIIISHGKPETEIIINHPKVINETTFRNKYYSMTRFYIAKQAKYDLILYLDDDILLSEDELNKLINMANNKGYNNLYGPVKRACSSKGYGNDNIDDNNLIILTGLALIGKKTSLEVLKLMEENKLIYNKVIEEKGNGEDILFSKTLVNNLGKNIYVPIYYEDLDKNNGYSSNPEHYTKRIELCKLFN